MPFEFKRTKSECYNLQKWDCPRGKTLTLKELAQSTNTSSLIVSQGDSILFEWYGKEVGADSALATFSIAKSFTGALTGIAIQEGIIPSIETPVLNYLPDLKMKRV